MFTKKLCTGSLETECIKCPVNSNRIASPDQNGQCLCLPEYVNEGDNTVCQLYDCDSYDGNGKLKIFITFYFFYIKKLFFFYQ